MAFQGKQRILYDIFQITGVLTLVNIPVDCPPGAFALCLLVFVEYGVISKPNSGYGGALRL